MWLRSLGVAGLRSTGLRLGRTSLQGYEVCDLGVGVKAKGLNGRDGKLGSELRIRTWILDPGLRSRAWGCEGSKRRRWVTSFVESG